MPGANKSIGTLGNFFINLGNKLILRAIINHYLKKNLAISCQFNITKP